jgi:hypothetical protein
LPAAIACGAKDALGVVSKAVAVALPEQRRLRLEMAIEGINYQFVRSEESSATAAS